VSKVEAIVYGDRSVYTVSAFNRGIARWLGKLPELWLEGEVTELRRNEAWATVYLTLKDPQTGASVPVTIARQRFDALELDLADGERVHVQGRAALYEARGELSFRATTIERFGLGEHLAALERLKRKLAAEGLFAAERKRPLPRFPRAVGLLTGVYYLIERRAYARESPAAILAEETTKRPIRVTGRWNLLLLAGIVLATAYLRSPFREAATFACAAASFPLTPRGLRAKAGFSWYPILDVAILFAGIFVAMEPALDVLRERAPSLGLTRPWHFFWVAGSLSALLDNAPTYAAFLAVARGLNRPEVAGVPADILGALSAGAVFFGGLTYIGNAPNFLVRSIAVYRGVAMPSFFGYTARAGAVLLPLFLFLTLVFFRG